MRNLISILLLSCLFSVSYGQTCIQANCKRTIQLPVDSVDLNSISTPSVPIVWSQVSGASTAIKSPTSFNTAVFGIQKAGTYIYRVGIGINYAQDTIIALAPLPCPPPSKADTIAIQALKVCPTCPPPVVCPIQRYVTNVDFGPGGKITITYQDGSKTIL